MKNNDIKIRVANENDYEVFNSIYRETLELYCENLPDNYKKPPKKTWTRGTFINAVEDKKELIIMAETTEQVVGMLYATIEKEDGDEWNHPYHRVSIDELFVLPQYENQGVGTKLMQEVESWAKTKSIKDLIVLVYDFNKKAISFYEKNDYKPYSIQMKKKI